MRAAQPTWGDWLARPKTVRCDYCERNVDRSEIGEATEVLGGIVCEDCTDEALAANSQFGVGA